MISGLFVTATATESGKTFISRALIRMLAGRGQAVLGLKPVETGADPEPADAVALARACGRPELARAPGFYRASLPLAPYAAALETKTPAPRVAELAAAVRAVRSPETVTLVEGAGGLLVPLNEQETIAELAAALELPLLIVAADQLGVLSAVASCVESARARALPIRAIVLSGREPDARDPSPRTNRVILERRLQLPVCSMPYCAAHDDDSLANAAERAGLLALLESRNF